MKRALLFDGFLDDTLIREKSDGLFLCNGGLCLSGTAQDTADSSRQDSSVTNYGGDLSTDIFTATGFGYLESCKLTASYLHAADREYLTATVAFLVNGVTLNTIQTTMRGSDSSFTLIPTENVPVCPGDRFQVVVTAPSNEWLRFESSAHNSKTMSAVITFRSGAASSGTMTSTAFALPGGFERARLYLHRREGSVTPVLNGAAMIFLATSDTVDETGNPCQEDVWELDAALRGPVTVGLTVTRGAESLCTVLDYGVVLF